MFFFLPCDFTPNFHKTVFFFFFFFCQIFLFSGFTQSVRNFDLFLQLVFTQIYLFSLFCILFSGLKTLRVVCSFHPVCVIVAIIVVWSRPTVLISFTLWFGVIDWLIESLLLLEVFAVCARARFVVNLLIVAACASFFRRRLNDIVFL